MMNDCESAKPDPRQRVTLLRLARQHNVVRISGSEDLGEASAIRLLERLGGFMDAMPSAASITAWNEGQREHEVAVGNG